MGRRRSKKKKTSFLNKDARPAAPAAGRSRGGMRRWFVDDRPRHVGGGLVDAAAGDDPPPLHPAGIFHIIIFFLDLFAIHS